MCVSECDIYIGRFMTFHDVCSDWLIFSKSVWCLIALLHFEINIFVILSNQMLKCDCTLLIMKYKLRIYTSMYIFARLVCYALFFEAHCASSVDFSRPCSSLGYADQPPSLKKDRLHFLVQTVEQCSETNAKSICF